MTKQQEALRIASRAFRVMSMGAKIDARELKILGDLCAITLPMKYRFDKKDLAEMEAFAKLTGEATDGRG